MSSIAKLESCYSEYQVLCQEFDALSLTDPKFEDKRDVVWRKTDEIVSQAAQYCNEMDHYSAEWFKTVLSSRQSFWDHGKNWFAVCVLRSVASVPRELALFTLGMAVDEPDPSYNRHFVEPSVRGLGAYEVCQYLLGVMRTGTNYEKAGALNALYWAASLFLHDEGLNFKEGVDKNSPECREMRRQILDEARRICLLEFVEDEDLDLRRSFVRWISADESKWPEDLRPKVREAVQVALNHSDEFIRQQMQRQLNPDGLIAALPPRQRPQGS